MVSTWESFGSWWQWWHPPSRLSNVRRREVKRGELKEDTMKDVDSGLNVLKNVDLKALTMQNNGVDMI